MAADLEGGTVNLARGNGNMQNDSCLLKINGIRDSLKAAERRLAYYILENPPRAAAMTMKELGEKSDSSYATIYRFAKRLGYPGFKELKSCLAREAKNRSDIEGQLNSVTIDITTSTERICSDIYDYSSRIIKDCVSIIDPKVIDSAIALILKAKTVHFIGSGTSYISSLYAYCKFFRLGVRCTHEPSPTFFRMQSALMTKDDLLFAISSSGRTKAIVEAARLARENGTKVIGLSDFAVSPLTKCSTVNLHTTSRHAGAYPDLDLPLVVGQLTIIDILHMCCCARMGNRARKAYRTTKAVVDGEKI